MKDMQKDKPRVKKIDGEVRSLKTSQRVPLCKGCHTWKGRWIKCGRLWTK